MPSTDLAKLPWVRTSERLTLNQCPQKWEWAYVHRLRGRSPSPALRFGSLIHAALEEFYLPGIKRGPKPAETFERLFDEQVKSALDQFGFRDEDDDWHNARELGVVMLEAYYEKFGKDTEWKVIATELPFHTVVRSPKTGKPMFVYVGVLDGVWMRRTDKTLWIVDHKTCKDDPTKKASALVMDEQAGAYWTVGVDALRKQGKLKENQKLSGMLYNFLRKGKPDDRPTNELGQALNKPTKAELKQFGPNFPGSVSKKQPAPLFHREPVFRDELMGETVRERIIAQYKQMRDMRRGKLPVIKHPGTLHNPHCNWCEFRDMCELHEMQQDWEAFKDAAFMEWEPYAQHEIEAGDRAA